MRIALAQLLLTDDPTINLKAVLDAIERGRDNVVDLMVFPEATMKAFGAGRLDTVAEDIDGQFATTIAEAAAAAGVTVVVGMFRPADTVERDGKTLKRVYNTLLCAGPEVAVEDGSNGSGDGGGATAFIECYDKIHLFDAFGFRESDTVAPGQGLVCIDIPVRSRAAAPMEHASSDLRQPLGAESVTLGLATCFDIRFPEQFIDLAQLGAEVIALPASWNDGPGKVSQWNTLTAARALDSTTYIAATGAAKPGGVAAAGSAEGPTGIGHSALAGPDGIVRVQGGYEPQLLIADIDVDDLDRVRRDIPVLQVRAGN